MSSPARSSRRLLLPGLVSGILGLSACSGEGAPQEDADGPAAPAERVILITCDTLRSDHLGSYGCDRELTPNLDRLAARSRVYSRAYACAPLTGPSLSCLLTGKLPDEIGVAAGNRSLMPATVLTLAEAAAEKGVPTAAVVSNYVLRRQPGGQGRVGVEQGFDHYDDRMSDRELHRPLFERRAGDTSAAAIAWIDDALSRGERTWFLWVHYQDPHGPYTPGPEQAARFDRAPAGARTLAIGRDNKGKGQLPAYQVLDGQRDPEPYRGRYDGEIATFDAAFGTLLDHLTARDLIDDALVIFSSDHGESLGEHDYWFSHGEHLHQEVVGVPLLVHFPGGARAGTSEELVSHLDLFPTAMEALGLDPGPTHGASLLQQDPSEPRVALASLGAAGKPGRQDAFSDGRWRLLLRGGTPELYDLDQDPGERTNLAGQRPRVLQRLQGLAVALAGAAGPPRQGVPRNMSREDRDAFEGLGYAGGDEDDE